MKSPQFSDVLHAYEATTALSRLPGQVALRGESGCSPRKALPGLRRIELFDVYHLVFDAGPRVTSQTGKTQVSCTVQP